MQGNDINQVNLINELIENGIKEQLFTCATIGLFQDGKDPIVISKGRISKDENVLINQNTLFDMASLTKVVATLPSILLSIQDGKLSLIDSITDILPELGESKKGITILHLLTHSSGLPAWRPFFINKKGRKDYIQAIADEPLIGLPGKQVVYSDLGFMLLGFILERIWDNHLDKIADQLVFKPLEMNNTTYQPLNKNMDSTLAIATTEVGNEFEYKMAYDYFNDQTKGKNLDGSLRIDSSQIENLNWRRSAIVGTVHDCNAFYGLNGISGHAGLFSTIYDVAKYMDIWNGNKNLIDTELKNLAFKNHSGIMTPMRGLGWELSTSGGTLEQMVMGCTGGDLISESGFGHTGFTGTSIWRDPKRKATLSILSNRVHPKANNIYKWRRAAHNRIFASIIERS